MRVIKSVKQRYSPSEQTLSLLEDFRLMMNDCIRIGLREKVTSMKSLCLKCYHTLEHYDNVATCYRLTAISKAAGVLRNYRKSLRKNPNTKIPYVKKMQLVDCYRFRIRGKRLRLTLRAHEYIYVDLSPHTLAVISGFTVRSVTLTNCTIILSFSKEMVVMEPAGVLGIDRNLDNITISTTNRQDITYNLSKATETKSNYHTVKSHFNRNDVRIRREIYRKYGEKQGNKVGNILHIVSKQIVQKAKAEKLGIAMENIKGIRNLYRKGNGQGNHYRGKMNSWSYFELQRQIEYKAKWEGIPVVYVDAWGTSSKCSTCGCKTYPNEHRQIYCPRCSISVDRDVNAARNVRDKGRVRFTIVEPPNEAMIQECGTSPLILQVDGGKLHRAQQTQQNHKILHLHSDISRL